MKGIDIFCSSPASTSICSSIDQRSIVSNGGGSRAIDRYNPHLIDRSRRIRPTPQFISDSSQKPKHNHDQHHHQHQNIRRNQKKKKTSSSSSSAAVLHPPPAAAADDEHLIITPGTSSRYLLGDTAYLDVISELEPQIDHFSSALIHLQSSTKTQSFESPVLALKDADAASCSTTAPDSSTSSNNSGCLDQVVELKVSLHCRGCERKMKKHISRMQGVRTFTIDFATKKVTVIGDVSPLSVLDSISRVKNAQFWTSSATTTPSANALTACR